MKIAIEGCAHGELEIIYNCINEIEEKNGCKIDLLICCGDFQSTRNNDDLFCMAVPDKYKQIGSFYKYYSGEKVAPVLTLFIGGNHEASNYLQELAYGGWVAPNIYYMGYANVINIGGIRIAGISGIYKSNDYFRGHFEQSPYNPSTIRSAYHIRALEIFRLQLLSGNIDIFLSHDWPNGITKYGNEKNLLKRKPFLKDDIEHGKLGSLPCMELLKQHYPTYWFSAHLHCKFAALVTKEESNKATKFLALDKCLPKRKFLQIIDLPHDENVPLTLSYDLEWLTILNLTNHLLSTQNYNSYMPGDDDRQNYQPTDQEKNKIRQKFQSLIIPDNFEKTVEPYQLNDSFKFNQPSSSINNQTSYFCDKLGIDDPIFILQNSGNNISKIDQSNDDITPFDAELTDNAPEDLTFNTDSTFNDTNSSEKSFDLSSEVVNKSSDTDECTEKSIPIEPNTKKFKRRNQSIYTSTDS